MSLPLVSVCVPNLNTRAYLQERVDTILAQTYTNWEMVVSDNYSDDGAWEFFEELARRDCRVLTAQAPRAGLYANWNECIRRARGEYVYIATSDDTMPPDCLEKLVGALEAHPDCDLAHCPLKCIDEHGRDLPDRWSHSSVFAMSSGPLLASRHVRRAPFDGLLHLSGRSVYISITQLLIRRSLFDRIGLFESAWGSLGDFNWDMRAALVANTVHVPDTWGGWRQHGTQATAVVQFGSPEHERRIDAMICHAIEATAALMPEELAERLKSEWSPEARSLRIFKAELAAQSSGLARRGALIRGLIGGSAPAREHFLGQVLNRPFHQRVRNRLEARGYGPVLVRAAGGPAGIAITA